MRGHFEDCGCPVIPKKVTPMRAQSLIPVLMLPLFMGCATVLAKKASPIAMTSSPAGAEIWIDGARVGTTPHTVELSNASEHVIVFTLEGRDEVSCLLNRKVGLGWVALDVLFFGWPLIVDAITGAWNRLDSDMCDVIITEIQDEVTSPSGNASPDGSGIGSGWSYQLTSPY
jgi:hypothetical protein